jgi:anti-sigma factor RsiW
MTDAWAAKLDTYLDGELSAKEMQELDSHLRSCTDCAAEVLHRVQLKRGLQSAGKRFSPSPQFRRRVQQQIASRPRHSVWKVWSTAAAVLATLIIAGILFSRVGGLRQERRQAYGEIADLHVSTLASTNPVDVISTDRHTVKPWFQGKLPFTFNLPELQNSEFTLLGGRVTYLEQAPGAHLIYQVRKHQISVFIFQDRAVDVGLAAAAGKDRSFNLQTWSEGGLRYFVIGDASSEDIARLAELLKTAARP